MYSESDFESAIAAGILDKNSVAAFRAHIAQTRETQAVDEEYFRLITSFNDIFVAIASILLLGAVSWIGCMVIEDSWQWLSGLVVAATAWGLAEFFTRKRRMALPSILLLFAFVSAVFMAAEFLLLSFSPDVTAQNLESENFFMGNGLWFGGLTTMAAIITAGAAYLHWRRFRVPITIAAGAAALAIALGSLILTLIPGTIDFLSSLTLLIGLLVFVFAMYWDKSDPARQTRRADVAFWLHLLAAQLIVHSIFVLVGVFEHNASATTAGTVIALYIGMGIVALVIDRRAVLVSSLFYVLYALSEVLKQFGAVDLNLALTGFIIGLGLLLLSVFWHKARAVIVRKLPSSWQKNLPLLE